MKLNLKSSEKGNAYLYLALFIAAVVLLVIFVIIPLFEKDVATTALTNVVDCHYTGAVDVKLGSESSPKEKKAMENAYPLDRGWMQVKYWSFLSDQLVVPKEGYGDIYARTEDYEYCIDNPEGGTTCIPDYYGDPEQGLPSFLVAGYTWMPTEVSQMGDTKMFFNLAYITGVSNTLHPLGAYVANPGFNPELEPNRMTWDLWASAACWLTVIDNGTKFEDTCLNFGFRPQPNITLQGPVKIERSGLFLVESCAQGIYVTAFENVDLNKMPSNIPTQTKSTFLSLFNIALP